VSLGVVAVLAMVASSVLRARRHAPLPIPVPPSIASLDPQVRDHLAQLAVFAGNAPTDSSRRVELGLAFAVNGLWAEARQCFRDAIALGESGPLPELYALVSAQELGEPEDALRQLQRHVQRYPEHAPSWQRLGTLLSAHGRHSEAAQAFETVTRLAPDEWRGWAGLGEARVRSGDAIAAIEPLERAVSLDPFARPARHVLGQAYRAAGRAADGERELAAGRGQSMGPMPDAWSLRALIHMKSLPDQFEQADSLIARGEVTGAVQLLQEARRFHPENIAVITRLAEALDSAGRPRDAWSLMETALAAYPEDIQLQITASHVSAALTHTNQALAFARSAIAKAPHLVEARVAEANALVAAGDDKTAAAALQEAVELAPGNVGLWLQLGDLQWRNLARPDDALQSYLKARRADPIHPVALERLAELHRERGDLEIVTNLMAELGRLVVNERGTQKESR
jgi:tetratricopeptide (TPR) repeat protein